MQKKYIINKNLFILTCTLILPIYFIIKECDYPLIWDNSLFRILFTHNNSEKLLYNISISYIAAYIFYIFQIYIPDITKNHHALFGLQTLIQKEIKLLKIFIFIIEKFILEIDEYQRIHFRKNIPSIYIQIKDCEKTFIKRFTFSTTLDEAIKELSKINSDIHSSSYFNNLDPYITNLLSSIPFDDLYSILRCINSNLNSSDNYTIIQSNAIDTIKIIISALEKNTFFYTTFTCHDINNETIQQQYDEQIKTHNLSELQFTLPINY